MKRHITVTDISPVPVSPSTDRRRIYRRSMEATILTSSPYKRKLAEDAELRTKKTKRTTKATKEVTKKQKPSDTKSTSKQRKTSKASAHKQRPSKKSTRLAEATTILDNAVKAAVQRGLIGNAVVGCRAESKSDVRCNQNNEVFSY